MGAQAIYIHTGDADIAVPVYTTDGDLLLEPARLKDEPKLTEAMERAQFRPGSQPGSWLREREVDSIPTTIPVDLLAGPAALLVAKLHKLAERSQERTAKRMKDKDALDVLRILRAVPSEILQETLDRLRNDDLAGIVTREALDYLRTFFGSRVSLGTQMAVRATERLEEPEMIAASCEALATELLQEFADTTR